jgi:hypothetical protein
VPPNVDCVQARVWLATDEQVPFPIPESHSLEVDAFLQKETILVCNSSGTA